MSLGELQRVLARMVADPAHRRWVARAPDDALAGLRLDGRERRRLIAFAGDPGMKVNTALYRANRLAPIYASLPRTCVELGPAFADVVRAFWSSRELEDLQFTSEAARFAGYLRAAHGAVLAERPGRAALLACELAIFEAMVAPRDDDAARVRVVAVDVDPAAMIEVLAGRRALAMADLGCGAILIDHRDEGLAIAPMTEDEWRGLEGEKLLR